MKALIRVRLQFMLVGSAVFFAILLAGCSGGGAGPTAPNVSVDPAQVEFDSFSLVNGARVENGVNPALGLEAILADVARRHSERMRDQGFFGHQDDLGQTGADRLQAAGVAYGFTGENLARTENIANPAAWAHDRLMASAEHRPNILSPNFDVVGVGVARAGNTYWITQVFVGQ